ncbi:hypothetical protein [Pseudomonas helleri]|uniref:hypothetical protein n=1 Tax=Pseudomonas helleri TaxID=1608996 RepID=UPI0028E29FFB|nr:hypothetical protein [Pseudomonas helleri]
MSKRPLGELIKSMQGKSSTVGWDAVVMYDQRKANELLYQLYVERYSTGEGIIEPASMEMVWGDGSYIEHLFDLKLGAPKLSFEKSSLEQPPRTRLTLDMIGGMIVSTNTLPGGGRYVSRIKQVLPVGGPQIWMDQPLTKGAVSVGGEVLIDIGEADNFKANFVVGSSSQDDVGRLFKEYFKALDAEQKRFSLGTLNCVPNGVLTPQNFEIKTRASAPSALMQTPEYGDGAIMLFVTLAGGKDGVAFPNETSDYLIPTDQNGDLYTGTVLLSSRVFMEKVIKPALEAAIGNGLVLSREGFDAGISSGLIAAAGGGITGINAPFSYWGQDSIGGNPVLKIAYANIETLAYRFQGDSSHNLRVSTEAKSLGVRVAWGAAGVDEYVINNSWRVGYQYDFNIELVCDLLLNTLTGIVSFGDARVLKESSEINFLNDGGDYWNADGKAANKAAIEGCIRGVLKSVIKKFDIPSVDTYLIRNLLFPGQNALQLTQAFVPGDLALFGHIDPLLTSVSISPLRHTIEAGGHIQFKVSQVLSNPGWSVRDVDAKAEQVGTISSTGYYTAPTQAHLASGVLTVMITVTGVLGGQTVKSSALISIMRSLIQVSDLFLTCDLNKTKELSATALDNAPLTFTLMTPEWGSTLTEVSGQVNERLYTAGGIVSSDVSYPVDVIEVKNGNATAYIHVLIQRNTLTAPVGIEELSESEQRSLKFNLLGSKGPLTPANWTLLAGEGSLDKDSGVYTEPDTVAPGSFAVIAGVFGTVDVSVHGFMAVPLPLSQYVDIIDSMNNAVQLSRLDISR